MAIARLGAIVAGIAGSLGPVTFQNGGAGLVLRQRQAYTQRQSQALADRQHSYCEIWHAWQSLTDDQRNTWINAAAQHSTTNRLGQARPLSPWRLFYTANATRYPITGDIIETFRTDTTAIFYTPPELSLFSGGPFELHATSGDNNYPQNASFRAARNFATTLPPKPRRFAPAGMYEATSYSRNLYDEITAAIGEPQDEEYLSLALTRCAAIYPYLSPIVITAQVQARGPEQIPAGTFEPPWNPAAPTPWVKSGTYTLTADTLFPYADTAHAELDFPATAGTKYLTAPGCINVTAGHTYRLSFAAYVSAGTFYRISTYTVGTGYWTPFTNITPGAWTRYTYDWTPGANGSNGDLYIQGAPNVAATVNLDNVSFRELL